MKQEDNLLLERTSMVLADLEAAYTSMDLENIKGEIHKPKHDIHLEILTCESIIKECAVEVESSSLEEIVETVKVVYHMNLSSSVEENSLLKLDEVTSKFLSSKKHKYEVNEEVLDAFREDMHLLLAVKDALNLRVSQLKKEKKWLFFIDRSLIEQYQKLLASFAALETKMLTAFNFMSELVTSYIVESFHYIYLCFAYMIKFFKQTNNQLVLVEIAASIDRFINIMQPLVKDTSLKNENLRNFYVIYELNVLKEKIVEHYE